VGCFFFEKIRVFLNPDHKGLPFALLHVARFRNATTVVLILFSTTPPSSNCPLFQAPLT